MVGEALAVGVGQPGEGSADIILAGEYRVSLWLDS